jgi:hypothetical protein
MHSYGYKLIFTVEIPEVLKVKLFAVLYLEKQIQIKVNLEIKFFYA